MFYRRAYLKREGAKQYLVKDYRFLGILLYRNKTEVR